MGIQTAYQLHHLEMADFAHSAYICTCGAYSIGGNSEEGAIRMANHLNTVNAPHLAEAKVTE